MLEPKFPVEKVPAKLLAGHLGNLMDEGVDGKGSGGNGWVGPMGAG